MWVIQGMKARMCWAALYSDSFVLSKYCGLPVELNENNLQIDEVTKFESVEQRVMLVNLHRAYFNIKKRGTEIRLIVKISKGGIFKRTRKVLILRTPSEQEKNAWQVAIHNQLGLLVQSKEKKKRFPSFQRRLSKLRQNSTTSSGAASSQGEQNRSSTYGSIGQASTVYIDDVDFPSMPGTSMRNLPEVIVTGELDALSDLTDEDFYPEAEDVAHLSELAELTCAPLVAEEIGDGACSKERSDWPDGETQAVEMNNSEDDGFFEQKTASAFQERKVATPQFSRNNSTTSETPGRQFSRNNSAISEPPGRQISRDDSVPSEALGRQFSGNDSATSEAKESQLSRMNSTTSSKIGESEYAQQILNSFEDLGNDIPDTPSQTESPENSARIPNSHHDRNWTEALDKALAAEDYEESLNEPYVTASANQERGRDKRVAFCERTFSVDKSHGRDVVSQPKELKGLVDEKAKFFEHIERVEAANAKQLPNKPKTPDRIRSFNAPQINKPAVKPAPPPKPMSRSISYPSTSSLNSEREFDCTGLSIKERLQILKAEPAKSFVNRSESTNRPAYRSPSKRRSRPISAPVVGSSDQPEIRRPVRSSVRRLGKRLEKVRESFNTKIGRRSPGDGSEISDTPKAGADRQLSVDSERSYTVSGSYCSRQTSRSSRMSRGASLEEPSFKTKLNKYSKRKSWATSARHLIVLRSSITNLSEAPKNFGKNAAGFISKSVSNVSLKAATVTNSILKKDSSPTAPQPCSSKTFVRVQPSFRTVQDQLYHPQDYFKRKKQAPVPPRTDGSSAGSRSKPKSPNPFIRAGERIHNFRRNFRSFREDLQKLAENYHSYRTSKNRPLASVRPSPAEAMTWAESFEKLIDSKYGCALFRAFLKREFSDENLDFWIAAEKYKKLPDDKLLDKAIRIYEEYVAEQSTREINVDSAIRRELQKTCEALTYETVNREIFSLAQRRIEGMLRNDAFPRFLQSQLYKDLLDPNTSTSQPSLFSL